MLVRHFINKKKIPCFLEFKKIIQDFEFIVLCWSQCKWLCYCVIMQWFSKWGHDFITCHFDLTLISLVQLIGLNENKARLYLSKWTKCVMSGECPAVKSSMASINSYNIFMPKIWSDDSVDLTVLGSQIRTRVWVTVCEYKAEKHWGFYPLEAVYLVAPHYVVAPHWLRNCFLKIYKFLV